MLKKSITYEDFNGETVTEDFYFNLSKAELIELEMSHKEGLKESLERIVADEDGKQIIAEMKNIVMKAYGKRSPDGKRFIKNQELRDEFESTEAYSVLFMELVTEADASVLFVTGIMPKGMVDENQGTLTAETASKSVDEPNLHPEPQILTQAEIVEMDRDELKSGLATGRYAL